MSPALSSCSGLKQVLLFAYHLFFIVDHIVIILSSSFSSCFCHLFVIFVMFYHLCSRLSSSYVFIIALPSLSSSIPHLIIFLVIFIILHSSPYHLFRHLYHPPTLFVLSFCHLVHPPILFSSSSLSSFLLVIFAVVINFHQPDKIMAPFYILSDLACSFIFFIVI